MHLRSVGIILVACVFVLLPTFLGIRNTLSDRLAASARLGGDGRRYLIDEVRRPGEPRTENSLPADGRLILVGVRAQCQPEPTVGSELATVCQRAALERASVAQGRTIERVVGRDAAFLRTPSDEHRFIELADGSISLFLGVDGVFATLIDPFIGKVLYRRQPFYNDWTGTAYLIEVLPAAERGPG